MPADFRFHPLATIVSLNQPWLQGRQGERMFSFPAVQPKAAREKGEVEKECWVSQTLLAARAFFNHVLFL